LYPTGIAHSGPPPSPLSSKPYEPISFATSLLSYPPWFASFPLLPLQLLSATLTLFVEALSRLLAPSCPRLPSPWPFPLSLARVSVLSPPSPQMRPKSSRSFGTNGQRLISQVGSLSHLTKDTNTYLSSRTMGTFTMYPVPMKSRTSSSYVHAFRSTFTFFVSFSHPVTFLVLDNERSSELTTLFRSQKPPVRFQHVPPNNHRSNKAERAIQTAKNHFIAVLSSIHITFPPDRWPKLLPLADP
jgi:hypothetical protein